MTQIAMQGPYRLDFDHVQQCTRNVTSGVYLLGETNTSGKFLITFVGADFEDLRSNLINRIGTAPMFKLHPTSGAAEAFIKHCILFHTFQPSGNYAHPERPAGSRIPCPYCR